MEIDSIRQSIIQKRDRLGWSNETLAEKSNVPLIVIQRFLEGSFCLSGYIEQIKSSLNQAFESKFLIEKENITETKKFIAPPPDSILKNRKPRKRRCEWALHYSQCIKCGSSDKPHIARGLCKNCYDQNIETRHKDINRIQKYGSSSQILTAKYLIENYVEQNKSLSDIAKETNCTRQYVHKKLKEHYIQLRSKSASRNLALEKNKLKFERLNEDGTSSFVSLKKVNVNEDFFSSWTSAMAYLLGVIYTDGCLLPSKIREPWRAKSTSTISRINIYQKEPELLEKALHLMDCDAKIYFFKEKKYGEITAGAIHAIEVANEKLFNDLINLGLTANKSLSVKFPDIPNEFVRHFIRGCWDGDGTVYIEKQSQKVCAGFVSGSLAFLKAMIDKLVDAGFPKRTFHKHNHTKSTYYFRFTGPQVPMLYHYLYDDVPETQYLKRKYDLFRLSLEMNRKQ